MAGLKELEKIDKELKKIDKELERYSKEQDIYLKSYKTSAERIAFLEGCSFANKRS